MADSYVADRPLPIATLRPMPWLILFLAGLLETAWAVGLKYTDGFTRPLPSILTGIAIVASMVLLSISLRQLPVGTAYAVWVGIGAAGAAVLGMVLFDEPRTPARLFFLALLVIAVMGLRATAGEVVPRVPGGETASGATRTD